MILTAPFFGRGIAFPLRLDPATGGLKMTEGRADDVSIALEYVADRYSIRPGDPGDRGNHIAEDMTHLLLCDQGEHDTLPEFGSRLHYVLFDPNNWASCQEFETWVEQATERWEKRARIPVPEGVEWRQTPEGIDEGQAPVRLKVEFIKSQVPGNLVAPFVTPRQARAQEYPLGDPDAAGHDWASRYYGARVYTDGDVQYIRPRKMRPAPFSADDQFYETVYGDTWLLVSHKLYGDIRFWWVVTDYYIQDAAERGESSDKMETCGDPEPGTLLRVPSRTRLLMEIAA